MGAFHRYPFACRFLFRLPRFLQWGFDNSAARLGVSFNNRFVRWTFLSCEKIYERTVAERTKNNRSRPLWRYDYSPCSICFFSFILDRIRKELVR